MEKKEQTQVKTEINTEFEDIEKKVHSEMLFMNKQLTSPVIKGYDFNQGVNY